MASVFDDIAVELIASDLATDVTYTPAGVSSVDEAVRVLIQEPLTGGEGAASSLLCLTGTVADSGFSKVPVRGDTFTIATVEYRVYEVQGPDQYGWIKIGVTK